LFKEWKHEKGKQFFLEYKEQNRGMEEKKVVRKKKEESNFFWITGRRTLGSHPTPVNHHLFLFPRPSSPSVFFICSSIFPISVSYLKE
jgi:hypothetical protein